MWNFSEHVLVEDPSSYSDDENNDTHLNNLEGTDLLESHVFDPHRMNFCRIDPGEKEIDFVEVTAIDINENKLYSGNLMITRYKIVFKPFDSSKKYLYTEFNAPNLTNEGDASICSNLTINKVYLDLPNYKKRFFTIPVHLLYWCNLTLNKKNSTEVYIDLETKDFRLIRLVVESQSKGYQLHEKIKKVAFPNVLAKEVFALKYRYPPHFTL